jgi:hypothetical protein
MEWKAYFNVRIDIKEGYFPQKALILTQGERSRQMREQHPGGERFF